MTENVGGTLVAEPTPSLITQVIGSTSDLAWERCELPAEAVTCDVTWCQGLHAAGPKDQWVTHERDVAAATRGDGALVIEVAVHQVIPTNAGAFLGLGDSVGVRTPKRPEICVFLYDTWPSARWVVHFNHRTDAGGIGMILRALGQYEFAGAIASAADLCREIEGAGK